MAGMEAWLCAVRDLGGANPEDNQPIRNETTITEQQMW